MVSNNLVLELHIIFLMRLKLKKIVGIISEDVWHNPCQGWWKRGVGCRALYAPPQILAE